MPTAKLTVLSARVAEVLRVAPHSARIAAVGILIEAAAPGQGLPEVFVRIHILGPGSLVFNLDQCSVGARNQLLHAWWPHR